MSSVVSHFRIYLRTYIKPFTIKVLVHLSKLCFSSTFYQFLPLCPFILPLSLPFTPPNLPITLSHFLTYVNPTIPHTEHFLCLSQALCFSSLPLRTPLSTLHTASAMQYALQAVTAGWGLGLPKEALLCFLYTLNLLIKQAFYTTTKATPVS